MTTDTNLLKKIKALLAKAEATQYPAEAEAFTAKAQELMGRYAIDMAMLGGYGADKKIICIDLAIVRPFVRAKGSLLHVIAINNRCVAVAPYSTRNKRPGYVFKLFGYEDDVNMVKMLFESLLIQQARALGFSERDRMAAGVHGKTWTNSFLIGYSHRIYERLHEMQKMTYADAGNSMALVLVGAGKRVEDAVRREMNVKNGTVASVEASASKAGRRAANNADLGRNVGNSTGRALNA